MARQVACGDYTLYEYLWRQDGIGIEIAEELIVPLREGLKELKDNPDKYKKYDSENGWGIYDAFVPFIEKYLAACEENPDAKIEVSV